MTALAVALNYVAPALLYPIAIALAVVAAAVAIFVLYRAVRRYSQCWAPERNDNGVRVGAPKVYDNRSLSLMLEQLQTQLQDIENIDSGSLTSSIGTTQGERRSSIDATAGLAFSAVPAAKPEGTGNGGGTKAPAVGGSGVSSDTDGVAAAPLKWSERAADLLEDQINLRYQIFNLRLLLERAISDRLTNDFQPRLQAVVALPISIETPEFAVGCAATVEVRFSIDDPQGQELSEAGKIERRPSLVALFPQEETYNTLSVDRRGAQGGVSASSGGIGISGSLARASNASYLRRQADIIAVEREPTKADRDRKRSEPLIVAWQFRPSAGEPSVKSGLRQVLAVLALPCVVDEGARDVKVNVEVRSLWQTWNAKAATSANGAGWRAAFTNRTARYDFGSHRQVSVPLARELEKALEPKIMSIDWYRIGPKNACVTVNGTNFFTGTAAVMGDKMIVADNGLTIKADTGLTIKSEQTLQLIVPQTALLEDALLNGRYGPSLEMKLQPAGLAPLKITGVWIDPKPGNQSYEAILNLTSRDGNPLNWTAFRSLPLPIFAINGNVIASGLQFDYPSDATTTDPATGVAGKTVFFTNVTARAVVNPEALGTSLLIAVRWPFCGSEWSLHYQTYNSASPITALRSDSGDDVVLFICGPDFDTGVSVILNQTYFISEGKELTWAATEISDVMRLQLPRTVVDAHHEFLVLRTGKATVRVPVPPAKDEAPAAIDLSKKPHFLNAKTTCTIDFSGTGLASIKRVCINGRELEFAPYGAADSISVVVDGASIPVAGKYSIEFETRAGQRLNAPIFVLQQSNGVTDDTHAQEVF